MKWVLTYVAPSSPSSVAPHYYAMGESACLEAGKLENGDEGFGWYFLFHLFPPSAPSCDGAASYT